MPIKRQKEWDMIMSAWTHPICKLCWSERHPDEEPWPAKFADEERCCYCGTLNFDGIYVRVNPVHVPCKGVHRD